MNNENYVSVLKSEMPEHGVREFRVDAPNFESARVMVQKEVAARIAGGFTDLTVVSIAREDFYCSYEQNKDKW